MNNMWTGKVDAKQVNCWALKGCTHNYQDWHPEAADKLPPPHWQSSTANKEMLYVPEFLVCQPIQAHKVRLGLQPQSPSFTYNHVQQEIHTWWSGWLQMRARCNTILDSFLESSSSALWGSPASSSNVACSTKINKESIRGPLILKWTKYSRLTLSSTTDLRTTLTWNLL